MGKIEDPSSSSPALFGHFDLILNLQIIIAAFFSLFILVVALVVGVISANISCCLWGIFAAVYAGVYAGFKFRVYRQLARPWETMNDKTPLVHLGGDSGVTSSINGISKDQEISQMSTFELNEQHASRLSLVLGVKYFAKFGVFFSLAACVGFIIFSSVSHKQYEGFVLGQQLNLSSHYYSAIMAFLCVLWALFLWDAANKYWKRYRDVYYEFAQQSSSESSFLLGLL